MMQNDPLETYYKGFEHVFPPALRRFSPLERGLWHFLAMFAIGMGAWYLHWRWTSSLNSDAMVFSVVIATCETLMFFATILFYYDIWDESPRHTAPKADTQKTTGNVVDIFITTYDEAPDLVALSIKDAMQVRTPKGFQTRVHVLDDGARPVMENIAQAQGATYHTRSGNEGFKAGNLKNALWQSDGDFIVIADADTRLLPEFLEQTLGYFHDPDVAWVQTPHWFYDIPQGRVAGARLAQWCLKKGWPKLAGLFSKTRMGRDPFLSDPALFFDVIQRRRDRHGASFCCGAGSIHRREAVFDCAMGEYLGTDLPDIGEKRPLIQRLIAKTRAFQPFRFHVSEDIYTSMLLHSQSGRNWRSCYHPTPVSRMLSPWSLEAWAAQRLKYAGGTFDIMLNRDVIWRGGMNWRVRLHYLATFVSYLSLIWMSVLLFSPAFTLITGIAPVEAYSLEFFLHLLPVLIANELALMVGCKGYDVQAGRVSVLATLPISLHGLYLALTRQKIGFKPTPKTAQNQNGLRFVMPHIGIITILIGAGIWGTVAHFAGSQNHTSALLIVNLFWMSWNIHALWKVVRLMGWRPDLTSTLPTPTLSQAAGGKIAKS